MWLIEGLCSLIYTVYSKNCNYSISDVREQVYRVVKHCKTNQVIFYGTEGEYLTGEKSVFQSFQKLVLSKKTCPIANKILYQLSNFLSSQNLRFSPVLSLFQPCVCIYVSHVRRGKMRHSQIQVLGNCSI